MRIAASPGGAFSRAAALLSIALRDDPAEDAGPWKTSCKNRALGPRPRPRAELEEEAGLQALGDRDGATAEVGGRGLGEDLPAGFAEELEPALEQGRADAVHRAMDRERVAFVAPGLEHDRGPEIPNDREMPGPGLVRDSGRKDGAERRVASHLGVEAVDNGRERLFGELSPARRLRDG